MVGIFAILSWLSRFAKAAPAPGSDVSRTPLLGENVLAAARPYVGLSESTGSNDGPVLLFVKNIWRRISGQERRLEWVEGWDWCAAFATHCVSLASPPGYLKRAAVWEIVRDARERGKFVDVSHGFNPKPGDLIIWKRKGDPRREGETGHVSICASWDGKRLRTIGGNEENSVREADVTNDLPRAVGVVAH